jgi:hypothetical protein
MVVMKFSLPVILLDELLKWVARNYADCKETGELVVILVATNHKQFTQISGILTISVIPDNPFEQLLQSNDRQ